MKKTLKEQLLALMPKCDLTHCYVVTDGGVHCYPTKYVLKNKKELLNVELECLDSVDDDLFLVLKWD